LTSPPMRLTTPITFSPDAARASTPGAEEILDAKRTPNKKGDGDNDTIVSDGSDLGLSLWELPMDTSLNIALLRGSRRGRWSGGNTSGFLEILH